VSLDDRDRPVDNVDVESAWQALKSRAGSQLIDVRTRAEWAYVGTPDLGPLSKRAVLVEWQTFPDQTFDPRFVERLAGELKVLGVKPTMTSSSSAAREAEVWLRLRPWQQWVTMPVTTSPAALKGRSTTTGIGVPSEVGRQPVFPGCKVRRMTSASSSPASVFEATAPHVQNTDQRRLYHPLL
jgi:hypothetical protein